MTKKLFTDCEAMEFSEKVLMVSGLLDLMDRITVSMIIKDWDHGIYLRARKLFDKWIILCGNAIGFPVKFANDAKNQNKVVRVVPSKDEVEVVENPS